MENTVFICKTLQNPYDIILKKLNLAKNTLFSFTPSGKPYLQDYPDFHFNISHSGEFTALALSDSQVGVDIEKLRDINLKIADRYFTDDEKAYVKDNKSFFYIWTRKEAYLKMTGEGLKGLRTCNILDNKKIKTFETEDFTLSVSSTNGKDFKVIYEENF